MLMEYLMLLQLRKEIMYNTQREKENLDV